MLATAQTLLPTIEQYCRQIENEFELISQERKENLHVLASYISEQLKQNKAVQLNFICTHNSRRSQLAQVWAQVGAMYYGISREKLQTFSGGTEATACNERTIAALQRVGFQIVKNGFITPTNPIYHLTYAQETSPLALFSKVYSDAANPQRDFAAVLVCSQADEACPIVRGAALRLYHGYEDPKKSDGTPQETAVYDATCRLIAREMLYLFSRIDKD